MEQIYHNLGIVKSPWGNSSSHQTSSLEVTGLWLDEASGEIHASHDAVDADDMTRWLTQHTRGSGNQAQSLMLRFVWVDVDAKNKMVRLSDAARTELLDSLGLGLAYRYSCSIISGATSFPPRCSSGPDFVQRAYSFCYIPKIAAIWSHRRARHPSGPAPVTQCIMFVQPKEKQALRKALSMSWDVSTYRNPMFPALVLSLLLGTQIDQSNSRIKEQLRAVESRTGYHAFEGRDGEEPAPQELGSLSAQTSGSAGKLASTMRKSKTLERLLDFILETLDEDTGWLRRGAASGDIDGTPRFSCDGCELLKSHVSLLKERQKDQLLDTEYTLKRVQVQSDALLSIITQKDSLHSLMLSQSTHEIAYYSYRDSSSMKTLAVVTMFFLPGSFVATLFSTQCFDWGSVNRQSSHIGVTPTPQFSLYWAITIPLTAVTFSMYSLWLYFQKRKRERVFNPKTADETGVEPGSKEAEGPSLVRTRRQTLFARRRASDSLAHKA